MPTTNTTAMRPNTQIHAAVVSYQGRMALRNTGEGFIMPILKMIGFQMSISILFFISNPKLSVQSTNLASCRTRKFFKYIWVCLLLGLFIGCAVSPKELQIEGHKKSYPPETIIQTASGLTVTFDQMMADLYSARIVYVGEQHTRPRDHAIQLKILKQLNAICPDAAVGMEMFSKPYQPILNRWAKGELTRQQFIEQTHWYANWKFDYALYEDLLSYVRKHRIPLFGLNVPFHIPSKVAAGGIDNLLPAQKAHLPDTIDTTNPEHRKFVKSIFEKHPRRGLKNFEYFYEAQCVWEDTMAAAVSQNLGDGWMVVFAGSGHLRHHYGIPLRAYKRNSVPYRTVIPVAAGETVKPDLADYIWVTGGASAKPPHPMPGSD